MDVPPVSFIPNDAEPRTRALTSVFGALLFREVLKPLTAALGPVGDAFADRIVDGVLGRPNA